MEHGKPTATNAGSSPQQIRVPLVLQRRVFKAINGAIIGRGWGRFIWAERTTVFNKIIPHSLAKTFFQPTRGLSLTW